MMIIPFSGLKEGSHEFEFQVGNKFFEDYESSEVKKGDLFVYLKLIKSSELLILEFHIKGTAIVICDRCLDDLEIPVDCRNKLYVKFGLFPEEQSDEVVVISQEDDEIDVSQFVYEYINLSLPYRKVHPEDSNGVSTCNKEMVEKLKEYSSKSSNKEIESDPRWDSLKNFLEDNN
jgi:uncharacterized protein